MPTIAELGWPEQAFSGGLFLFYFQFVLGFSTQAQTLAAIYFIAGLIGVPLWWYAGRRLGKHRGLQIALTYTFKGAKPKGSDIFDASFLPAEAARKVN